MSFFHRAGPQQRRRPRLQRQLFAWLLLTVVATALAMAAILALTSDEKLPFKVDRVDSFVSGRFADVWQDEARRSQLAVSLAETIPGGGISVVDAKGIEITRAGRQCKGNSHVIVVQRGTTELGSVRLCMKYDGKRWPGLLALVTAGFVLWLAAALLARRLTRPWSALIAVTRELGSGNLKSRARLRRGSGGELGVLAESINDMAERIERQLSEQRELLAAVSHEVRSPLARLRVATELLRTSAGDEQALLSIEREVSEIDAVVGKLLASSRLDFGSPAKTWLEPRKLAATALERRNLPLDLLDDQSAGQRVELDPTLIALALDNLLENAGTYGEGVVRLRVRKAEPREHARGESAVAFEIEDAGAGFPLEALGRAFDAFYRAPGVEAGSSTSLGLGLSLVRRVAHAHDGSAWAKNLPTRGAVVGFSAG